MDRVRFSDNETHQETNLTIGSKIGRKEVHSEGRSAQRKARQSLGQKATRSALSVTLAMTLIASPIIPSVGGFYVSAASAATTTAATQGPTVSVVSEQIVSSGVTLQQVVWKSMRGNVAVSSNANVLKIDLHNPYAKLDVMTGKNNQFTTRQSVRGMALETGALAGVNGDFYAVTGEGAPLGGQISNGQLMSSPSILQGMYAFALTKDNQPVIDRFTFTGSVASEGGRVEFPLAGVNSAVYWTEPNKKHSHQDVIHLYTSAWGSKSRAMDTMTTPTELLVQGGIVVQISEKQQLDMVPPADGYILRAAGTMGPLLAKSFNVGDRIYTDYQLVPVDSSKSYDTSNFQMMIGGHTILVDNGTVAKFSRDVSGLAGYRSRTGLGYSKDGRYAYLLTVDAVGDSKGMSLSEFQNFMLSMGVWKGLNLDGGGSTQMVSRPLGDTDAILVNKPENGTARLVVNGLGVYTTAPQGQLAGVFIQSENAMFINEKKILQLKAYDEFYNPMKVDPTGLAWTASSDVGVFVGPEFTALKPGTVKVTAKGNGDITHSKEIDVVGRKDINSMTFETKDFVVTEGDSLELPVIVATVKGVKRTVPAELLEWEFIGFDGTFEAQSNTVKVDKVDSGGSARIIARYDGYAAMLTKPTGTEKLFADFESGGKTFDMRSNVTPSDVYGNVQIETDHMWEQPDNAVLSLQYDFRQGVGTKALYAEFGTEPVAVEGTPSRIAMNVEGDNSLNWLRAEFVDANGKSHLVDIANPVNWTGWKTVSADLEAYKMAYPIKLKRLYVANPELGQDEREPIGAIAVDDISFQYKGVTPELPKASVKMAVGRTSLTVNGEEQKLELAPMLENKTTLIPVRFFIDAMGGEIRWEQDSKRVSIIRDNHLIELWIDDASVVIDGKRVESLVAPKLVKKRTMLPLRLISEALGWKVGWDQKTKSITLE